MPQRRKTPARRGQRVSRAYPAIQQGTGASVPQPFQRQQRKKRGNARPSRASHDASCWNAFHSSHLALPRAVAPYTVIRTTAIWNPGTAEERRLALFGPSIDVGADGGRWSSSYAWSPANGTTGATLASSAGSSYLWSFSSLLTDSWRAASVTPAAFSIQVMNKEPLQTADGILYVGRSKNKVNVSEFATQSFDTIGTNLVSYANPRLCSGGKLSLAGVHIDAVPNNMSELAKFTTLGRLPADPTLHTFGPTNTWHQEGFNPIFVYNPDLIDIQVLVCCEWRVRFDPTNPAFAACVPRPPSTDSAWHSMMTHALSYGNGVMDIAQAVAQFGGPALDLARRAAPAARALAITA